MDDSETLTADEAQLRFALELANSSLVDPEVKADARAFVDRVFAESLRALRVSALKRRLHNATDLSEVRAIAKELREI